MPHLYGRYTQEDLHDKALRFAGDYPEIVIYFFQRFDPERESLLEFITREKSKHITFLEKRGWKEEEIDMLWGGIISNLAAKRQRVQFRRSQSRMHIERRDGKWVIVG